MKKITPEKILKDFQYAYECKRKWIKEATQDLEFVLGKQWEKEDEEVLKNAGIIPLTINKCKPIIQLLSGIQRQNRSDFKAFPVGTEDQIKSDIATMLLKHILTEAEGVYKISEEFEDAAKVGEGWLEPWIDYSEDIINGKLKFRKGNPFMIFPDPAAKEYDFSDAEYIFKFSPGLRKEQLYRLFPKNKKEIDAIENGKIDFEDLKLTFSNTDVHRSPGEYSRGDKITGIERSLDEPTYDLLEMYYKNYITKYYVIDKEASKIFEVENKQEAERMIEDNIIAKKEEILENMMREWTGELVQPGETPEPAIIESQREANRKIVDQMGLESDLTIVERIEPEIRLVSLVGTQNIISDDICWSYPKYKGIPLFWIAAYRNTIPTKNPELDIQGIIRNIKPLQIEINKRRTQELRHLNSIANSGWITQEGAWVDKNVVQKYGSTPGIILEYKRGYEKPDRIKPQPLSSGHDRLVQESSQDIKDSSGINTDLLAMAEGGQASGRAIALRQRQGLVMVQDLFDNLSRSNRLLGKFLISILSDLFIVDTAMKVVGEAYIKQNFSRPIPTGQVDPMSGQPVIEEMVDMESAKQVFEEILKGLESKEYDISIGEGVNTETVKFANYLLLKELMEAGAPIPPEALIDESSLSAEQKERIKKYMEQARVQM